MSIYELKIFSQTVIYNPHNTDVKNIIAIKAWLYNDNFIHGWHSVFYSLWELKTLYLFLS